MLVKMKNNNRFVRFPKQLTEELAEFIGAYYGDGNMCGAKKSDHGHMFRIDGNLKKDKKYIAYLADKIEKLFGICPSILFNEKASNIYLKVYSKKLCEFLHTNLGFKYGDKGVLKLPSEIISQRGLLIAFLRGLFDTDGCVTYQKVNNKKYVQLKITTQYKTFADEIKNCLLPFGIKSHVCWKCQDPKSGGSYDVSISCKSSRTWFEIIGSHNDRNIDRFKELNGDVKI